MTKDFEAASITANAGLEKSSDVSRLQLTAVFGGGVRLSNRLALLSEISALDLGSSDARRVTLRMGLRRKIDENQVIFGAVGIDLDGGNDGLRHLYWSIGYQRFTGHKDQ